MAAKVIPQTYTWHENMRFFVVRPPSPEEMPVSDAVHHPPQTLAAPMGQA